MLALDSLHLGFFLFVQSYVRFGSIMLVIGIACLAPLLPTLDWVTLDFELSVRSLARLDSAVFVLDHLRSDSILFLQSYAYPDLTPSVPGTS